MTKKIALLLVAGLMAGAVSHSAEKSADARRDRLKIIIMSRLSKKASQQDKAGVSAAIDAMPESQLEAVNAQLEADPAAPVHFSALAKPKQSSKKSLNSRWADAGEEGRPLKAAANPGADAAASGGGTGSETDAAYDEAAANPREQARQARLDKKQARKAAAGARREKTREKIQAAAQKAYEAKLVALGEAKYPKYKTITGKDASELKPGETYRREFSSGGRKRFYEVHIPKSYRHGAPHAAVLDIHGGSGDPTHQAEDSQMNAASERLGFVAVYPAGTSEYGGHILLTWNVGDNSTYASLAGVDDKSYFRTLLDDISRLFTLNPDRIYSTGLSQGGSMSYILACDPQLSRRVAAVAPVAAVLVMPLPDCKPSHPVSVIHFHGTADNHTPYNGGVGEHHPNQQLSRISAADTIKFWLAADSLPAEPSKTDKKGNAELKAYGPAASGAEVRLWTLVGGGHTWPGSPSSARVSSQGPVNMDINATNLMLEFFLAHPSAKAGAR